MSATAEALRDALAAHGLQLRGSWTPSPADALPALPDGQAAGVVWMVGAVGSGFWPFFKASPFFRDGLGDPLDRWSQSIGEELATRFGGRALYPFEGPPYYPFQQWADRSEATHSSRMMLRIHPRYGLWHAYRFALALPAPLPPQKTSVQPPAPDLCARCSDQPCLQACPVQAYTGDRFVVDACAGHLRTEQGKTCMQTGCLARQACPVGGDFRYTAEHAAFHMRAFCERH